MECWKEYNTKIKLAKNVALQQRKVNAHLSFWALYRAPLPSPSSATPNAHVQWPFKILGKVSGHQPEHKNSKLRGMCLAGILPSSR